MPRVLFKKTGDTFTCEEGKYLLDLCEEHNCPIRFSCRAGACGACVIDVSVTPEGLNPMTAREKRTLETIGADLSKHRLACINRVLNDLEVGDATTTTSERARATGIRTGFEAEVVHTRHLTDIVREVTLKLIHPAIISFLPGQYLSFTIKDHEHIRRSYSISSSPEDRHRVTLCVRATSGGLGSNYIHRLEPGNRVQFDGPYGEFILNQSSHRAIIFIANGTGISPIMAMLRHLVDAKAKQKIQLYFGLRHANDIFYQEELEKIAKALPQFKYTLCLSQPFPNRWDGFVGRVTQLIEKEIKEVMAKTHEAYLCGGQGLINDSSKILLGKGFSEEQIYHENFYS
ncbi:MAG TPA: 2Fe-2S iron-sulfur cluster binding domain-containing protein [Nitrospiria bacterium]|jgi:NAD(P)H-flavin reductase/ferredoxin